jgi:general secretion pathway protein D
VYNARVQRARAAQAAAAARARAAGTSGDQAAEQVRQGVYLDADERTNRILMIGAEDQLRTVEGLIDALDVEQQDLRTLKPYRIRHVDAEEVARKLHELGIISRLPEDSMRSTVRQQEMSRTSAQASRATAAAAEAAAAAASSTETTDRSVVDEPQVVVVESTNSLLVNATAEQHLQIETIIGYVDSQMLDDEIPYKIYPLENSSPSHLATVLESLIYETTEQPGAEGDDIERVVMREEKIKIVPDPNTYSLIVYANKKNQEWVSNLVQQLDRRRPQVLIDVTLVEISHNDQFEYDLNVIESFPDLTATSGLTGGIAGEITSSSIIDSLLSNNQDRFIDVQSNSGSGTAFYGDRHVNALLTAMKSKSYGRVLAKPKILVNDNEMGSIETQDKVYVKTTGSTISGETGLSQSTESWEEYPTGITLEITPHISEGALLRLEVSLHRSDVDETKSTAGAPPATNESDINTVVTVPDKSTIILGGLLRLDQNKGGSKVPILGDLPLVGTLFRSIDNSDAQRKLYVFVKAEIIRPSTSVAHGMEGLEAISERNRMAFEGHEDEFQGYQNVPGLKARPMMPMKVLEAD